MALFDFMKAKDVTAEDTKALNNQIATDHSDGAVTLENAVNSFIMNFDWVANSQAELIDKYREVANYNEVDYAIEDIINEMVSFSEDEEPVKLNLENCELSESIKTKVQASFTKISDMMSLKDTIHQRARNFYTDGRLAYQKVVDQKKISSGLINVVELDVKNITKFRNIKYNSETKTIDGIEEYFIYNEALNKDGKQTKQSVVNNKQYKEALQLAKESITYVTSGLIDPTTGFAISWLHKAIKPTNQLRMMENALVIYRITRAPERRAFYIDTGNLPVSKAEQYINNLKNSYKNRMSYDAESGSFKDNRHLQTMQEDFWLPRTSTGKGTEVSNISGGANLGDIEDVIYFLKRLYKALNIPVSRLEADASAIIGGRGSEINRDELKFSKFVSKIRKRLNIMFKDLLRTDLILTKILTDKEWAAIENKVEFIYAQDMYLEERKFFEMMRDRLELATDLIPYVGKYYSHDFIRREILQQTDEEKKQNDKEIAKELTIKQFQPAEDEFGGSPSDEKDDEQEVEPEEKVEEPAEPKINKDDEN